MEVYSTIAKQNPAWTAEQETEFIRSCTTRTGKWKSKAMKDKFVSEAVKRNMGLVFKLINRYAFDKSSEDLMQRVLVAVSESLKKFDPSSGYKISTWIQQPIVWAIKQTQTNTYDRGRSIHDEVVALNRKYNFHMSVVSVDATVSTHDEGSNGDTIGNLISTQNVAIDYLAARSFRTNDDDIRDGEVKAGLDALMVILPKILNKKEVRVVKYMLKGLNQTQIATKLKVTRMRISQISAKAFEKIRNSKYGNRLKGLLA